MSCSGLGETIGKSPTADPDPLESAMKKTKQAVKTLTVEKKKTPQASAKAGPPVRFRPY